MTVFQEPELSAKGLQVDASGRVAFPLVGSFEAKGRRPRRWRASLTIVRREIFKDPCDRDGRDPSVSKKCRSGRGRRARRLPISGPTTLRDVISMAKGETEVASLNQIASSARERQRMGAVLTLQHSPGRIGRPVIQGNDLVVGISRGRFWQNVRPPPAAQRLPPVCNLSSKELDHERDTPGRTRGARQRLPALADSLTRSPHSSCTPGPPLVRPTENLVAFCATACS